MTWEYVEEPADTLIYSAFMLNCLVMLRDIYILTGFCKILHLGKEATGPSTYLGNLITFVNLY